MSVPCRSTPLPDCTSRKGDSEAKRRGENDDKREFKIVQLTFPPRKGRRKEEAGRRKEDSVLFHPFVKIIHGVPFFPAESFPRVISESPIPCGFAPPAPAAGSPQV